MWEFSSFFQEFLIISFGLIFSAIDALINIFSAYFLR